MSNIHLMLDIETLSQLPDAAVFEVAVVPFSFKSFELVHPKFHDTCRPDPRASYDYDTVRMWSMQEHPLPEPVNNERLLVTNLELYLLRFVDCLLWAKSPSFDCVILQSMFHRNNYKFPIPFRQWRDVRTLTGEAHAVGCSFSDIYNDNKHNAYADCVYQIDLVRHARKHLVNLGAKKNA